MFLGITYVLNITYVLSSSMYFAKKSLITFNFFRKCLTIEQKVKDMGTFSLSKKCPQNDIILSKNQSLAPPQTSLQSPVKAPLA